MQRSSHNLFISLGAQKTGTSFLADYLREHPECSLPPVKEVHFFDRTYLRSKDYALTRLTQDIERSKHNLQRCWPWQTAKKAVEKTKIAFLERQFELCNEDRLDAASYEKFILSVAQPGTKLVADMTPANGLLPKARLEQLAALESQPKFLLVLRDPVDRLWSHMRMMAKREAMTGVDINDAITQILRDYLDGKCPSMDDRSNYVDILQNVSSAIPKDRLRIKYFEEFLTDEGLEDFCDFTGIKYLQTNASSPSHVGTPIKLATDLRQKLQDNLRPQYDAAHDFFGYLPKHWEKSAGMS